MTRRSPRPDVAAFETNLTAFIRNFGLLRPDHTPCGQPLHVSQAHAIAVIASNAGCSQQDLAATLGLARATVSELVSGLCDRGWLQRSRDDADRRVQRLQLTPSGEAIAASMRASRRALLAETLENLTADERDTVVSAIGRLADAAARVARPTPSTTTAHVAS